MKNSIITTGGKYSTARMLVDYTDKLYMPLIKLTNEHFNILERAVEYTSWKKDIYTNWNNITIEQEDNPENININTNFRNIPCPFYMNSIKNFSRTFELVFISYNTFLHPF